MEIFYFNIAETQLRPVGQQLRFGMMEIPHNSGAQNAQSEILSERSKAARNPEELPRVFGDMTRFSQADCAPGIVKCYLIIRNC